MAEAADTRNITE